MKIGASNKYISFYSERYNILTFSSTKENFRIILLNLQKIKYEK